MNFLLVLFGYVCLSYFESSYVIYTDITDIEIDVMRIYKYISDVNNQLHNGLTLNDYFLYQRAFSDTEMSFSLLHLRCSYVFHS